MNSQQAFIEIWAQAGLLRRSDLALKWRSLQDCMRQEDHRLLRFESVTSRSLIRRTVGRIVLASPQRSGTPSQRDYDEDAAMGGWCDALRPFALETYENGPAIVDKLRETRL